MREQNNEYQLKIKELEHNINKHRKDSQDAADKVRLKVHLLFFFFFILWSSHQFLILLFKTLNHGFLSELFCSSFCSFLVSSRWLGCWRNMTGSSQSAASSVSQTPPTTSRPTTLVRRVNGWRSWRRPPPSWRGTSTRGRWTCWMRRRRGWGDRGGQRDWEALSNKFVHTKHPSRPAVQWPDEEEEDRGERQRKNSTDYQGTGPEEEWSSEPGLAEGLYLFLDTSRSTVSFSKHSFLCLI